MIRLIVNADDLGQQPANNDAIFKLMEMRKLTSATLMVNGAGFDDAVRRLKDFPECSFGVHLDLVEFDFITGDEALIKAGLIDGNHHVKSNIRRRFLLPGKSLIDAIFNEWCAQIEKALDNKVPISHLDSHKHTHTVRYLANAFIRLCEKYHINKIRNKNQNFFYMDDRPLYRRMLRDFKRRAWCNKMSAHLITPDHFDEAKSGIEYLATHKIDRDLSIEWMCHPGCRSFKHDFDLMSQNWESRILSPFKLISFNEL